MVYDRIAERYDRLMAPLERAVLRRWRREAVESLPPDSRILEVGAGTGANFEFYPDSSVAIATEISIGMLGRARDRAVGINLVQASVEELPFASSSFDAAFATLVFCSVKDVRRQTSDVRRQMSDVRC